MTVAWPAPGPVCLLAQGEPRKANPSLTIPSVQSIGFTRQWQCAEVRIISTEIGP